MYEDYFHLNTYTLFSFQCHFFLKTLDFNLSLTNVKIDAVAYSVCLKLDLDE